GPPDYSSSPCPLITYRSAVGPRHEGQRRDLPSRTTPAADAQHGWALLHPNDRFSEGVLAPMATTQLLAARAGQITPEMEFCAKREDLPVELTRDEVAAGRMVIPANRVHLQQALQPMCIGIAAKCKINANVGNGAVTSNNQEELEKLHTAVHFGADTVMDLSTGKDIDNI